VLFNLADSLKMEVGDSCFAESNNVQEALAILKDAGGPSFTSKCGCDTEKEKDTPDAGSSKHQHDNNSDLAALETAGYEVVPNMIVHDHGTFDMGDQVSVEICNVELC
jgi:hypothetical protein